MKVLCGILIACMLFVAQTADAVQTKITVRAKARDAKFITTSMGGALVVIRDSDTGEVLAKGLTAGSTGNTNRIMLEPIRRGARLADTATGKFEATIDLESPKLVTIEVHAPYAQRQSMTRTATQVWLVPGKNVEGDGIVLEVPGFVVDIVSPASPDGIKLTSGTASVLVRAIVTMMCGCTLNPGGVWDSSKYEIVAIVLHNGKTIATVPLAYAGKPSYFEVSVEVKTEGMYELVVYAYDPGTGNTGVDKTTFTVY